jgi:hypothetical protein
LGPVFMFCATGLILGGTEGARSRFHVLRSRTRLGLYRGRRVLFSLFSLPDFFWAVPRALGPVFMFCAPRLILGGIESAGSSFHIFHSSGSFLAVPRAPGPVLMFYALRLIFDGTDGVGSRFHILRSRTRFRRYSGRRFPFSCFTVPDSFWAVPRAPGPVFFFCAPELIFDGSEGVSSLFHYFRS